MERTTYIYCAIVTSVVGTLEMGVTRGEANAQGLRDAHLRKGQPGHWLVPGTFDRHYVEQGTLP